MKLQYETAPLHKNPVDRLFTKVLLVVNINDLQCTKMLFCFSFYTCSASRRRRERLRVHAATLGYKLHTPGTGTAPPPHGIYR